LRRGLLGCSFGFGSRSGLGSGWETSWHDRCRGWWRAEDWRDTERLAIEQALASFSGYYTSWLCLETV